MVFIATGLIVLGGICALMGQKIFRFMLPIIGFVAGMMVGFGGVQGVFGTGAVSVTVGIIMALIVGVIMAVLSFMFYEVAVIVLMVMLGVSGASYLGVALGLGDNGFILMLMAIAGGVMGFVFATSTFISIELVFALTALLGVSFVLAGVLLLVGEYSLDQLHEQGIVSSVVNTVDQSFLWLLAWLGGSIFAMSVQRRVAKEEFLGDMYAFEETK